MLFALIGRDIGRSPELRIRALLPTLNDPEG
jgi:hypothetical protein